MPRSGSWKDRLGRRDYGGGLVAVSGETRDKLARVLLAASLAAIAFCALFPFDFNSPGGTSAIRHRFDTGIGQYFTAGDTIQNIVFFMPLGFALGAVFLRRPSQRVALGVIASAIGAVVTVTVEMLQCYVLERDPSIVDVVNNTLGTAAGYVVYVFLGGARALDATATWVQNVGNRNGLLLPGAMFGIVALLACVMPLVIGSDAGKLSSWSPTYPLALGNEIGADRVWTGRIWHIAIANRAADRAQTAALLSGQAPADVLGGSLVALYDLRGEPPFPDRTGRNPALDLFRRAATQSSRPARPATHRTETFPRSATQATAPPSTSVANLQPIDESAEAHQLWHEGWLRSAEPVEGISRSLASADALTIVMKLATEKPDQYGQARVLTISSGIMQRNFMIGQDGVNLVVRVRTAATGANADAPEFIVPDVFIDSKPRTLVITFADARLRVFVDDLNWHAAAPITPEAAVVWSIYPRNYWRFQMAGDDVSRIALIYRAFAFVPLGMLAAATANQLPRSRKERALTAVAMVVAVIVILEALLTTVGGQRLSVANVIVSASSAAMGLLIVRLRRDSAWSRPGATR